MMIWRGLQPQLLAALMLEMAHRKGKARPAVREATKPQASQPAEAVVPGPGPEVWPGQPVQRSR